MEEEDFKKSINCLKNIVFSFKEILSGLKEGETPTDKLLNIQDDLSTIQTLVNKDS